MYLFRLALASLANRRFTALLTIFAIAPLRLPAAGGGAGPHRGQDQLRQYHLRNRPDRRRALRLGEPAALSVFRIGNATNNIRWDSYRHFAENPRVKWAIPISSATRTAATG